MKTIKVSTLESRFNKLHSVANYAEDCMLAIAMHTERLLKNNYSDGLAVKVAEFHLAVGEWSGELAKFASLCQTVESHYYEHLSDGNTKCELIEVIPSYSSREVPSEFSMQLTMYEMGYYTTYEDFCGIKKKIFSDEEILSDIEKLHTYAVLCLKAMANMNYKGIWEHVGQKACDIHDMFCEGPNAKLFPILDAARRDKRK